LRAAVLVAGGSGRPTDAPVVAKCHKADEWFPSITPHDLRHTAASLAVSAGANVKAVQRMLGYAKASMTLDVYANLFDEGLDGVADRLDTAIRSAAARLRPEGSSTWLTRKYDMTCGNSVELRGAKGIRTPVDSSENMR
jgi:hypothetical protein